MTDRKLLELAAKAAGIEGRYHEIHPEDGAFCFSCGIMRKGSTLKPWNPLTNDGEALRLAVKLNIGIDPRHAAVAAVSFNREHATIEFGGNGTMQQATRLAIVRIASEIGRTMP